VHAHLVVTKGFLGTAVKGEVAEMGVTVTISPGTISQRVCQTIQGKSYALSFGECADHVIVTGAPLLRRVLREYVADYNADRTHVALDKDSPATRPVQAPRRGKVIVLRTQMVPSAEPGFD